MFSDELPITLAAVSSSGVLATVGTSAARAGPLAIPATDTSKASATTPAVEGAFHAAVSTSVRPRRTSETISTRRRG
jgi:hypothetical protein